MKLVTFRAIGGGTVDDRAGMLVDDGRTVVDLALALSWLERREGRPDDEARVALRYGRGVLGFVEHADVARPAADAIAIARQNASLPGAIDAGPLVHPLTDVTLQAPIPRPPSLRDGYAFRQHVETARRNRGLGMIAEFDQFPVFYFSNHRSVIGPGDVHVKPRHLDRLDYELEAAVVVGTSIKDLGADEADGAIFGLTIMNDWSARGLQLEEMKLNLGPAKGKDFATSLGPWLVTLDELLPRARRTDAGLVFDLPMRASVNGELLSRGNTRDMTWTFAQILERASYGAWLEPGDVIGSGTCGTGCLLELNGTRALTGGGESAETWLAPGDEVSLEIDGLGRLDSRVVLDP